MTREEKDIEHIILNDSDNIIIERPKCKDIMHGQAKVQKQYFDKLYKEQGKEHRLIIKINQ